MSISRVQTAHLSHEEIRRYSRHLIMPEFGLEGQSKLKQASVLLVGVGGLGAPLALYLAAAGVGHLGLVDFDVVEESNLQRQVVHGASMVGQKKIESARRRLLDLNRHIQISTYEEPLTAENALAIMKDFDIIADGTDNFQTRYLVNDACVLLGKPNVYGSIFRFEGQASVFAAANGPCYRCLYPEPPLAGTVPSCAEGGVLGVLPGIIGTIQATEVIKLIVGVGTPLIGRLLLYDALSMSFSTLPARRNPNCLVCSAQPLITELIDYDQFCGILPKPLGERDNLEITVQELHNRLEQHDPDLVVIDVREPPEWDIVYLEEAEFIPRMSLPAHLHKLDPHREYVLYCKSGGRSLEAAKLMVDAGFKAKSVRGGINAWALEIDPSLPRY